MAMGYACGNAATPVCDTPDVGGDIMRIASQARTHTRLKRVCQLPTEVAVSVASGPDLALGLQQPHLQLCAALHAAFAATHPLHAAARHTRHHQLSLLPSESVGRPA